MPNRSIPVRRRTGLAGIVSAAVLAAGLCLPAPPAAALPADAEPPTEPPVLLHRRHFLTPGEMAGTGLTPEVKLRARIDARGRVSEVEILAVEPAAMNAPFRDYVKRFQEGGFAAW